MTFFDDFVINSMEDLITLIREVGFVPFFSNEIEGFSIEEHIDPALWYDTGDTWEAWDWKGPVIRKAKCAYGKFLKGKAMYISAKWFPEKNLIMCKSCFIKGGGNKNETICHR